MNKPHNSNDCFEPPDHQKIGGFFVAGGTVRKLLLFLFMLTLPISANAVTCNAGYYLVSQNVPAGYTELEYIESTGTQYIDTGIKLISDDVTYEWTAKDNGANGYYTSLFGAEYGTSTSDRLFSGILHGVNNSYRGLYIGSTVVNVGYSSSDHAFHDWTLVINSNHTTYLIKDGAQLSSVNWTGSLNKETGIILFATFYFDGYIAHKSSIILKYFRIIDNGAVVFNGIPARRNSDNAVGMYDTVTDTFFTNSGTGTFVAGADTGTCEPCPAGYACANGVQTNCANVTGPNGRPTYSAAGASSCTECPAISDELANRYMYYNYWPPDIHTSIENCIVSISDNDPDGDYIINAWFRNGQYGGGFVQTFKPYTCAAGKYSTIKSTPEWIGDSYNSANCYTGVDCMRGRVCTNVGAGYYSPDGDTARYACDAKPANSHFTCSGTTNDHPWECDAGYGLYNGVCHARCPYGDGELHVGQYTHPLWADITNVPSPSVYIGELGPNHDGLCYAYLEPDDTPVDNHHGFHTVHNGVPYHAINLGLYGLE